MIDYSLPFYSGLKDKEKLWIREKCYLDVLNCTIASMFDYSTDDKELENILNLRFEYLLRCFGKLAFTKYNDKLVFGRCHFAEEIDIYSFGTKVVVILENGVTLERTTGKDAIIIFNNLYGHSETNILRYAEHLSQVDLSKVDLLLNARSHPIIVAPDDETKTVIETALNNTKIGNSKTIACSGSITNNLLTGKDGIEVMTVTDPQTAQLFQYYSHYAKDVKNDLYEVYGLSTMNTGKMAQTNDTEVSGTLASSMVIPLHNYKIRAMGLELVKEKFGVDIKIEFGISWKNQLNMLNGFNKSELDIVETEDDTSVGDISRANDNDTNGEGGNGDEK